MEKRKAGPLQVSAVGLGLMSMSGIYGNANDDESIGVIHHAIDQGIDFLDSSDMYGWGHNETLLGRALKGKQGQALVVTKFGQTKSADGKQGVDGRPEYVIQACEASLKRLGVDVIDLYYQHRVDTNTPIEETVGAMKRLVEQGKVRVLGLSEAAPETIRRAHKVHPIAAVQTEYSLLYRKEAEETLRTTRELGISFVAYSPLGRSMLSGGVRSKADVPEGDRRLAHPRFQGGNLDKNLSLIQKLDGIAKAKGCTLAQLTLAWLLAQGNDIIPIPGTKRKDRVDENVGALKVKLSPDEVKQISDAVPATAVAGTRYPAEGMKRVFI
jgi:aryl-alcohol dehydrogenase-like predicted oxidoreductase